MRLSRATFENTEREPLDFARRRDGILDFAGARDETFDFARGLLLAASIGPICLIAPQAALRAPSWRGLEIFAFILLIPAFLFLAGALQGGAHQAEAERSPLFARLAQGAKGFIPAGLLVLALLWTALILHWSWRVVFAIAAPAAQATALAPVYAAIMAMIGRWGVWEILLFALVVHFLGLLNGATGAYVAAPFVFYGFGYVFGRNLPAARAWAADHRGLSLAAAPLLLVLTIAASFSLRGPFSLLAFGPSAIVLGVGAGLSAWALAEALYGQGPLFIALGKMIKPIAIIWPPLFLLACALTRADAIGTLMALAAASFCLSIFCARVWRS